MRRSLTPVIAVAALSLLVPSANATEVWSGRTFSFTRPVGVDHTQPQYQDHITPQVWITRANTEGIFNIKSEPGYTINVSPSGTEWATGDAVNHASLTFKPWQLWCTGNPPATVGVNAVVHLIADDIYMDVRFTQWTIGPGGGFSYLRATAPPVRVSPTTWARLKNLYH